MIQPKRMFSALFVGVFGLLGPVLTATAPAQTVVVTAKSIKDLAGDLEYLVKTVAPEGDANVENILGALKQFQSGDLVKGLDQSRGFGLAVALPPDFPGGGPPSIVAAVPVTDLGAFLDSIKGLGIAVDDQPGVAGFSHKVTAPDGNMSLFVLASKGYALFSLVPDGVDKLKEMDPGSWAPKDRPGVSLSARVRLSELPKALKDQFLAQMKAGLDQQEGRKPGEDDATYQGRIAAQKAGESTITALVRDGDSIEMAFDLDRKTSAMAFDLTVAAKPGTELAGSLRGFQRRRSLFQGLGGDGPLAAWASIPMARSVRDGLSKGLEQARDADVPGLATAEQKKVLVRFLDLIQSNLEADDLDGGLAFRRSAAEGDRPALYTTLAGLKVRDGKAFDRWFRDAVEQLKPEKKGFEATLDVARAADGTAIHQIVGPFGKDDDDEDEADADDDDEDDDEDDEDVVRIFGKAKLAVAFRGDAIVAAFGEHAVGSVREAVEGLSTPAPAESGAVGPITLVARLSGFDGFPDDEEERKTYKQAAAEAFRGKDAKKDRFSMSLKGDGDAIRLRLSVDVPALKFLAAVGHASKD